MSCHWEGSQWLAHKTRPFSFQYEITFQENFCFVIYSKCNQTSTTLCKFSVERHSGGKASPHSSISKRVLPNAVLNTPACHCPEFLPRSLTIVSRVTGSWDHPTVQDVRADTLASATWGNLSISSCVSSPLKPFIWPFRMRAAVTVGIPMPTKRHTSVTHWYNTLQMHISRKGKSPWP